MNAQQILGGLGWSAAATGVSAVCQFLFMAVMARLLDPAAFGLMAMAVMALRFAGFVSQTGFAQAIVQRPHLVPQDTTAALVMALGVGVVLCVGTVLAAPWFAVGFRTPELSALIGVLALSLPLNALGALPLAVLRRQARFKRVAAIEVSAFVLGYGAVGMACARHGLGVWSLVAALLSQQALTLVLGFATVRYPLAWPVQRSAVWGLWAYGSRHSLIGFLEFLWISADSMLIGRHFGKVDLGRFNRAITLTQLPVELGVSAVTKVLFPALSGMQQDRRKLADGFRILLLGVGLFSSAVACGIAAAAPDVVAFLFGEKWLSTAPIVEIVQILAFGVPPMFLYVACGITLDSLGELAPKLRLQALMLGVKIALLLALARWGLVGIACAGVIAEALRLAFGLRLTGRLLGIDCAQWGCFVGLFTVTGFMVWAGVSVVASVSLGLGAPLVGRVLLETLAGTAALGCAVGLLVLRFPGYAPLQRFDTVRHWHGRLLQALRVQAVQP